MLRDLGRSLGVTTVAVAALMGLVLFAVAGSVPAAPDVELRRAVDTWAVVLVLVASAGMVSKDRGDGTYRVLFVRPVDPVAYYMVRFLVGAVAIALTVPVLAIPVAVLRGVVPWSWPALATLELRYLLLGGLVFALSTVTRRDWLPALLLHILVTLVVTLEVRVAVHPVVRAVVQALPPFHLLDRPALLRGAALAHVVLYGVALVLCAVMVLRFRPLGHGGRT